MCSELCVVFFQTWPAWLPVATAYPRQPGPYQLSTPASLPAKLPVTHLLIDPHSSAEPRVLRCTSILCRTALVTISSRKNVHYQDTLILEFKWSEPCPVDREPDCRNPNSTISHSRLSRRVSTMCHTYTIHTL